MYFHSIQDAQQKERRRVQTYVLIFHSPVLSTQNRLLTALPPTPATPLYIKYYLLTYNVLSFLGWSSVLLLTLAHLLGLNISPFAPHSQPPSIPAKQSSFFSSLLSSKSGHFTHPARSSFLTIPLPRPLVPFYARTKTTYASVGLLTAYVQSAATLELVHVLLGWVGSPLVTTAMQVASRLFLVWVITWGFEQVRSWRFFAQARYSLICNMCIMHMQTRTNPFYTSMILCWSLTEAIRYSFYAFSLLPSVATPKFLVYLRYTTFFVLYPLGAGSEAALIWASVHRQGKWGIIEWIRVAFFLIWWSGKYSFCLHDFFSLLLTSMSF